jgi:cytochrome c-type biogenesis protein CcmH/NrfF
MSESRRQLLSIGVFFIIAVVAILLYEPAKVFADWLNIFPTIFILFGAWLLILAAMSAQNPQKYERTPFGTLEMGIILMALGGAWLLFKTSYLYSLALLLLVLGAIAIAAALRRKKP